MDFSVQLPPARQVRDMWLCQNAIQERKQADFIGAWRSGSTHMTLTHTFFRRFESCRASHMAE
mgnify:CR=1 FL=1